MTAREISEELVARILAGKAPAKVTATVLDLSGLQNPKLLPADLECHTLIWRNSPLVEFPPGIRVNHKLDLSGSIRLERLPDGLSVPVMVLSRCLRLAALPETLKVDFLNIDGCTALSHWPESVRASIGSVSARNCSALTELPATLGPVTTLDLRDCTRLREVPDGVRVRAWIDIGGTGIDHLPDTLSGTGLRWRGVAVTPQIAFFPESLQSSDALVERNAEVRRVMIERIGFERFLAESHAKVLHEDSDPGGKRQLLQVDLAEDEPLVCVSVRCPSTDRHYLIRVPPSMRTCHQAVAWTAGFDNPDDYVPVAET